MAILLAASSVSYTPVAATAQPHPQTATKSAGDSGITHISTGLGTKTAAGSRAIPTQAKAAVTGQQAMVTVRPGDSLWSIAAEVLHIGRPGPVGRYVERIYNRNRGVIGDDPSLIYAGQQLRLPGVGGNEPVSLDNGEGVGSGRFVDRTVRVSRGDTLWSIADRALEQVLTRSEARRVVRFLPLVHKSNRSLLVSLVAEGPVEHSKNDVRRYVERIHEANEEVIGPNPDVVHSGQVVELPTIGGSTVTSLDRSALIGAKEHPGQFLGWVRRVAGLPKTEPMGAASGKGRRECCPGRQVARTGNAPANASVGLTDQPAKDDSESNPGPLLVPLLVAGFVLLFLAAFVLFLMALLWRSQALRGAHALTRVRRSPAEGVPERASPNPLLFLGSRPSAKPDESPRATTDSEIAR
ncbi:MAG: LysM peptidoglycan-binding domain-containing protein [Actinomycetota bacterium]|nr:LysM peptidoglycan-binding domain-containing protein [Actinomycetota bacterium]